ncbi:DUF4362 domain-containing protein [Xylanibacillus composti]|nr:DUF4362 domain-containing protein [Xylanibacillus composti]
MSHIKIRSGGWEYTLKKTICLVLCFILVACNNLYDEEERRGEIVDVHGNITNAERLDEFLSHINSGVEDRIRITTYTIEGDPINYDFTFDGQYVKYKYDNSRDKFGIKNVRSTTCMKMSKLTSHTMVEYKLDECFGENKEIGEQFSFVLNLDR